MGNLYVGLLHYPVKNARGQIVATALTGLDLHDIARSATTFGVRRYYLVTPLASQRRIARKMLAYWAQPGAGPQNRAEALKCVRVVATLEDSLSDVRALEGQPPLLVATSAQRLQAPPLGYAKVRRALEGGSQAVYVALGTGWGLADELLPQFDAVLPPIYGPGAFNHLSVRAAAAIILDRLKGRRENDDVRSPDPGR